MNVDLWAQTTGADMSDSTNSALPGIDSNTLDVVPNKSVGGF